ncbi:hypothetical protein GEMRC1_011836 [Eukaryota sp. GEM-RC1]
MSLQIRSGHNTFVLEKDSTIIGRAEDCDILLHSRSISQHHCKITTSPKLTITDLDSRNGTFVNDQRIAGSTTCPTVPCYIKFGYDVANYILEPTKTSSVNDPLEPSPKTSSVAVIDAFPKVKPVSTPPPQPKPKLHSLPTKRNVIPAKTESPSNPSPSTAELTIEANKIIKNWEVAKSKSLVVSSTQTDSLPTTTQSDLIDCSSQTIDSLEPVNSEPNEQLLILQEKVATLNQINQRQAKFHEEVCRSKDVVIGNLRRLIADKLSSSLDSDKQLSIKELLSNVEQIEQENRKLRLELGKKS